MGWYVPLGQYTTAIEMAFAANLLIPAWASVFRLMRER